MIQIRSNCYYFDIFHHQKFMYDYNGIEKNHNHIIDS
jgi:hypothetical protein